MLNRVDKSKGNWDKKATAKADNCSRVVEKVNLPLAV
jgi:hypothetical protein